MPDLNQLQRQRNEKLEKMRSIMNMAHTENRDLTEGEIQEFNGLDEEAKRINDSIDREMRLLKLENETRQLPQIQLGDNNNSNNNRTGGGDERREDIPFQNLGEFFATIAVNRNDERLRPYQWRAHEIPGEQRTTMVAGVGSLGGFMIPQQLYTGTPLSVVPQRSIIRPGATVIPAGYPPDAEMPVPALAQGASQNMYGGVTIYRQGETVSITESNAEVRQVILKPKPMKGFISLSNDLMNNWAAASIFVQAQMRLATMGAEDYDFYRGSGANCATGIINAACRIDYSRATASQISFADVTGMFARAKLGGRPVWVASQTTIPQLANIRDTGNNNLWIQNSANDVPSRMFGFDVEWNDRSPALGSRGDLALVDRSYYLIKDGSGPRVDISTEFRFQQDETCFRIVWMVDGQAWLNEPIPLEGSTSNTISPFVILE